MKIFKRKYRIVTDNFAGFEIQARVWYWPFWYQISGYSCCPGINTWKSVERAKMFLDGYVEKENKLRTKFKSKVVCYV